eukprot:TRINITY_DN7457_c0_g1_i1.p1 TRINITY_DN7457_c0_g1~~TRINITY_DN7457_c0_g1_i1.p1  ORF type:complete len:441 (-),score=151.04 TRINITY_DN7457_c0_g1_i1:228-1550(-)
MDNCVGSHVDLMPVIGKFQASAPVRDKKKGLFTGKDVVDWLMANAGDLTSREQALKLGLQLEGSGVFHHVTDDVELLDDDATWYEMPKKIKKGDKKFNFSKKKLKKVTPFLCWLIHNNNVLEVLQLNNNELTSVPPAMFISLKSDLARRLKVLHLNNNQITQLPEEIGTLVNLVELNISFNALTALPPELSNLKKLETLEAANNKLSSLPDELATITTLKKLALNGNKLAVISSAFGQLNLKMFLLFENPITDPPTSVVMDGSQAILSYLKKKGESEKLKEAMRKKLGPAAEKGEKGKKKEASLVLERILFDPKGREALRAFLKTEFSEENFLFYEEVENFQKLPDSDSEAIEAEAERIFNKYISKESQLEINIPANIKTALQKKFLEVSWEDFGTSGINKEVFNTAQSSILKTLKADSLPRFIGSDIYKTYKTLKVLGK